MERARALRPGLSLTPETVTAIAEICRRLDGLPLAIELAAARVKLLPPAALLARLDRRLALLRGSDRGRPARQQTLRAAIQWSWELLSEPEQMLFRRLGVFAGGWTLEAGEQVCSPDGELGVLSELEALVDQSLVQQTEREGEPCFTMLATLREFALEQLAGAGEAEPLTRRHAEYYAELAERALAAYWRTGRIVDDVLRPLDPKQDNLWAALGWALAHGEATLGQWLAGGLGVWSLRRAPARGCAGRRRCWRCRPVQCRRQPAAVRSSALARAHWGSEMFRRPSPILGRQPISIAPLSTAADRFSGVEHVRREEPQRN